MLRTTYLNLKKPEGADPVNVQDFNDNTDTLDTEINARVKASGGDIANTKVSAYTASTASYPVPAAGETPKVFMGKIKKFFEDIRNATTGACFIGQIVNNCVTNNAKLPLSAAQGKALMDLYTQLNSDFGELREKINADAYGPLILASGASGSVYYERSNRIFNLYINGISGINIPAHTWVVIAGPISPEFQSKSDHDGMIGLCIIGSSVCQVRLNKSTNNIEIYSVTTYSSDYPMFGFGTWIYG